MADNRTKYTPTSKTTEHKVHPPHCQFTISEEFKFYEGSLIGLGIKFFLYQRGQISVPYETLHSNSCDSVALDANDYLLLKIPGEIMNPLKRLEYMKQQQFNMRQEKKRLKRRMADNRNELTAKASLEPTLQNLVDLLGSLSRLNSNNSPTNIAFALFFGSTIYNCKEIIVFSSINPSLCGDFRNSSANDDDEEELDKTKIAKLFYKSIIMSEHFGNFVSSRLRPCKSHLNLMTQKPLSETIILKHGLSLLENFTLPQPLEVENEKIPFSYRPRSQPKIFHINFRVHDRESHTSNYNDLSEYYNYRVPMTFKGMRKIYS